MKKVLFLMLFLLIVGAANMSSQVRIGGNGVPNGAAVLDLNATDATNNGTRGLALPRVSLANNTAQITSGTANLSGMLVYNTNATLGVGVYYWDGSKWVKVSDGSFVEGDGVVGNEVTDATISGGLTRAGSGTASAPYTLGIADGGVTTKKISASGASPNTMLVFDGTSVKWAVSVTRGFSFDTIKGRQVVKPGWLLLVLDTLVPVRYSEGLGHSISLPAYDPERLLCHNTHTGIWSDSWRLDNQQILWSFPADRTLNSTDRIRCYELR